MLPHEYQYALFLSYECNLHPFDPWILSKSRCYPYLQVISYIRGPLLFIFNFHPKDSYDCYSIGVEEAGEYQVSVGTS